MTTAIYYETEAVTAADVQCARGMAGPGALEFAPANTVWAEDIGGPSPHREPSFRSLQYVDELMPWVVRLGEALEHDAPDVARRHGTSLAEVAKYELLFDLAKAAQRWHALTDIRQRAMPDRLLWMTDQRASDGELGALARSAAPLRLEVQRVSAPATPTLPAAWASLRRAIGPPLKDAGQLLKSAVRRPRWPQSQAEVIVTEYFPSSVAASLPVAQKLEAEHGVRVLWLAARRKVSDTLAVRGVKSLLLPELLSSSVILSGRLTASQRRAIRSSLRSLPAEILCSTGGQEGRDYFLAVLERRLVRAWTNAAYWVEAYREAFDALRPKVVLSTTYSSSMGRSAALAARRLGGQAVYLQHGLFSDYSLHSHFCHDLLLMWGQRNLRNLARFGFDPRQVSVTGATIYDKLAHSSRQESSSPAQGGAGLRVAYMASRSGGTMVSLELARTCLLAVVEAVRRTAGAHLTVKMHPGDHTGLIPGLMEQFPEFTVVERGSSQDVILDSDVVIVSSSTTGFEACVADKPLVVLDAFDDAGAVPYVGYGAAVRVGLGGVDLAAELTQTIASLQHSPLQIAALAEGRRRLLDDMLDGCVGDATDRAAAAVLGLLKREPRFASSQPMMTPKS